MSNSMDNMSTNRGLEIGIKPANVLLAILGLKNDKTEKENFLFEKLQQSKDDLSSIVLSKEEAIVLQDIVLDARLATKFDHFKPYYDEILSILSKKI